MADIFDEVSEELKQDQLINIWKKHSKLIVSLISIVIISIISYQVFMSWNKKKIETISEQYFNAIEKLQDKKYSKSKELFLKNSKQKNGYKMLSLFGLAESNYREGNFDQMISNYKTIYDDNNIDVYYRYLARMLSVIKDNSSSFDQQKLLLDPILNSPSKLQPLASELKIILLIKFDKIKEAQKAIKTLLDRKEISFEQKNRLELIGKIYNNDKL